MGLFGRRKEHPVAAPKVTRCSECKEEMSIYDAFCDACGAPSEDYQFDQTVTEVDEVRDFPPTPLPKTHYGVG